MTTPTTPGTAGDDPDRIRAEIERTQTHLSSDVNALAEKITPGRIVERRVERARNAAGRLKDKVMGSDDSTPYNGADPYGAGYPDPYAGGSAHRAVSDTGSGVADAASSAATRVSDAAASASDAVQEAPQLVRQQTRGNPLAAGLIAFGAGWLVSSLLPASRREQQLAEQAREKAGELGQPLAEKAKQAATEVRDNLQEPAREAVESVRSTATDAGRTVADESRSAAQDVQGSSYDAAGTVRSSTSS